MPVLGFDIFRGRTTQDSTTPGTTTATTPEEITALVTPQVVDEVSESSDSPVFYMETRAGSDAQAQIIDGEFTLLAGSVIPAVMKDSPNMSESTRKQFVLRQAQHAKVLEVSTPCPKPGLVQLAKDVVFTSPSAAGAIVYGRATANGRITWKTETGQTLGNWEQGQTADA